MAIFLDRVQVKLIDRNERADCRLVAVTTGTIIYARRAQLSDESAGREIAVVWANTPKTIFTNPPKVIDAR